MSNSARDCSLSVVTYTVLLNLPFYRLSEPQLPRVIDRNNLVYFFTAILFPSFEYRNLPKYLLYLGVFSLQYCNFFISCFAKKHYLLIGTRPTTSISSSCCSIRNATSSYKRLYVHTENSGSIFLQIRIQLFSVYGIVSAPFLMRIQIRIQHK